MGVESQVTGLRSGNLDVPVWDGVGDYCKEDFGSYSVR